MNRPTLPESRTLRNLRAELAAREHQTVHLAPRCTTPTPRAIAKPVPTARGCMAQPAFAA